MFGTRTNTFKSKFNSGGRLIISRKHQNYIDKKRQQPRGQQPRGQRGGRVVEEEEQSLGEKLETAGHFAGRVGDKVKEFGKVLPIGGEKFKRGGDMIKLFGDAAVIVNKFTSIPQHYPEEKHMVLKDNEGEFVRGKYLGPSTRIWQRIMDKDEPVSFIDGYAAIHDIDYTLAKNVGEVRDADQRLIEKAAEAEQKGLDHPVNILQGKIGIKSKMLIEDNLGVPTTFFADYGHGDLTPTQLKAMRERREVLRQKGYGSVAEQMACEKREHTHKNRPSRALYRSLCKQTKTQKKKARKKKKYHKIVKERMDAMRKAETEFNSKAIPNSVINAIKGMKF